MPARRREAPETRRQQIFDAAEVVLLERGLAETTMSDVADRAGVAKGTIYLYCPSKADMLAELRARYLARFAAALSTRKRTARGALHHFIEALYDFSVTNQRLHHVLFHEAGYSEADALEGGQQLLASILRDGRDRKEFDVADEQLTAVFLMSAIHGALVAALHAGSERSRFISVTTKLVDRALAG